MGNVTIEKSNSLYWLGRYIERVFTTMDVYEDLFDEMLDGDDQCYHKFLEYLDLEDNYNNDAHFITSYLFDINNPDSLYANLSRGYDNAIMLREEISSETLSFVQMAMNCFITMEESDAPIMELQSVRDCIYAFWGSIDENVDSELCRTIIKCGKYAERVDLYFRLSFDQNLIDRSVSKLSNRLEMIERIYHIDGLADLDFLKKDKSVAHLDYLQQLRLLTSLFEVKYSETSKF